MDIDDRESTDERMRIAGERRARQVEKRKKRQEKYRKILERDSYTCTYCGEPADTVDHRVPKALGGGEDDDNLAAACEDCNQHKGHLTEQDFIKSKWLRKHLTSLEKGEIKCAISVSGR